MTSSAAAPPGVAAQPDGYYSQVRPDLIRLVPGEVRTVLDCGCGEGRFGESLRARGCSVTGIDVHPAAANAARQRLDRVLEGAVEECLSALDPESFDCIVCADLLEHLVEPWRTAQQLATRLRPGGVFICSVPNVRHLAVLVDLVVRGRWTYRDSGVLDRTHLRFFTRQSAIDMIRSAGLEVDVVTANVETFTGLLGFGAMCLRAFSRDFDVAQWVIRARKPQ